MNILLAFKAEPDLSMLTEIDWQAAADGNQAPDPSLMRVIMGNDEQGAAELMLSARERNPALRLSAITLGDERAMSALRYLAALGIERNTLMKCSGDIRFAPAFVAGQLAQYIDQQAIDLVLLGTQSSEGLNGQTGWLLAEMLGWPCLTQVTGFVSRGEGFEVRCEGAGYRQRWQLRHPAVLMVQNRGQLALRVPGMRARLASAKAEIEHIESPGTFLPLTCTTLARQPHRRAGTIIAGGNSREKAQRLWQDYLKQRMAG